MYFRNCPSCHGTGSFLRIGKCTYCHGKRKVSSDFIKWELKREKYKQRIRMQLEILLYKDVDNKLKEWDKKYIKPVKFKRY